MNFLMQPAPTATPVAAEPPYPSLNRESNANYGPKHLTTLEGLIAKDAFPLRSIGEDNEDDTDGTGDEDGRVFGSSAKNDTPIVENYTDVGEDEGWITIPQKDLPSNWSEASDILSLCSLDRSFLFPGEQVHILACLSASKQEIEIITPFKVAAAMSKNGFRKNTKNQNGNIEVDSGSGSTRESPDSGDTDKNGENNFNEEINKEKHVASGESLLRIEDHKRQTQALLQRFENSHFFVRISESDVPLWSKRNSKEEFQPPSSVKDRSAKRKGTLNAVIDKGSFDTRASGGLARNAVKCCSLANGDIVILLKVNIGVDFVKDPVLEILQFEKHHDKNTTTEAQENLVPANQDPCGDLLKWLLPLNNTMPPPSRPLSPPNLSSNSNIRSTSNKSNFSSSSGSQMFSFGHFRSYSMSSLPPNSAASAATANVSSKPNIDLEDWKQISSPKYEESPKTGNEGMLSFRGVSLEPNRFSVQCGLEGIYIPGRRWRRKIDIVQPVEIRTFAADCNTDDLLCVQIKNITPDHASDVVIYVDAITIVFEEAAKSGPPISLPVACIEAGNDHSLPNLPLSMHTTLKQCLHGVINLPYAYHIKCIWLFSDEPVKRRGEEHSFILKPATSRLKTTKGKGGNNYSLVGSTLSIPTNLTKGNQITDQFAVLVSCRCNCTESKLFFKKTTSWRPRNSKDMLISVASEMCRQNLSSSGSVTQLPVQVLTLQASNLTAEDLTLTVLAPASVTSPPSVLSLNSSPSTPMSPFIGNFNTTVNVPSERRGNQNGDEKTVPISDVLPTTDLGCTHLWLQSRVPLGCVPSQSTTTIKLELLPLTDGIITLDSLQIDVKEKGMTYIPEHSLKINATSSIASGII